MDSIKERSAEAFPQLIMHITGILETIMLICFGFSWPINLVKNYRMGSAKNMSLSFLLLIWGGYVAGVTAKLIALFSPQLASPTWYLMSIYVINLCMLTLNLLVYIRNKQLDQKNGVS